MKNYPTYYYEDTNRWKIFDLDVWGNQDEGYEINDFWEIAQVTFSDKEIELDSKIIDKLIALELLKPEAVDLTYIDSDYGCLTICDLETDKPIYVLEMVQIFHKRGE